MMRQTRPLRPAKAGFTLVELLVVVAIIAILMSIAIPALLRARIAANETSCMGSLRAIATGQEQFRTNTLVDVDGSGSGEFGFITEIAGVEPYRTGGCLTAGPARPAFIPSSFGVAVQNSAVFVSNHSGYHLRLFLPDLEGQVDAIAETLPLPCDPNAARTQEQRWVAYGWPTSIGVTGNAAFFVNQRAEIYFKANVTGARWSSTTNMPQTGNEALAPGETNLDGFPPGLGLISQDGDLWRPL